MLTTSVRSDRYFISRVYAMFALYINKEELSRRCKSSGVRVPGSTRAALLDACMTHGLIQSVHKTALRFRKQEQAAAEAFLESATDVQEARDSVFEQYEDYYCSDDYRYHKGYTLSYTEISDMVLGCEDAIRLGALKNWCEDNGGIADVMRRGDVPSSVRLELWSDHVNTLRDTMPFPRETDIVTELCKDLSIDTIGMQDQDVRNLSEELCIKCNACKKARADVRDWLRDLMITYTDVGARISDAYSFFTEPVVHKELEDRFGGEIALVTSKWPEQIMRMSMKARSKPELVAEALQNRRCIRCRGCPASTCVNHMCGACCKSSDCPRHRPRH